MEFVKQRRLELGLSLQDLAESLGFKNASTYMKYEEGSYSFKANQLPALANKLECRIENFFGLGFAKIAK
nr:helix-turn-helix transcriptional regulator [Paenibacillus sp. F411]